MDMDHARLAKLLGSDGAQLVEETFAHWGGELPDGKVMVDRARLWSLIELLAGYRYEAGTLEARKDDPTDRGGFHAYGQAMAKANDAMGEIQRMLGIDPYADE